MLIGLFIVVDEDFDHPIYAEPVVEEFDAELWAELTEIVEEVLEGDRKAVGIQEVGSYSIGWKTYMRNRLTFVAVVEGVERPALHQFLAELGRTYFDEVDDVRNPEREGVVDVVVEVIPPWEDDA